MELGRNKEGLEELDKLVRQDPLNPKRLVIKSQFLLKLGKKKEARVTIDQAWKVLKDADEKYKYKILAIQLRSDLEML